MKTRLVLLLMVFVIGSALVAFGEGGQEKQAEGVPPKLVLMNAGALGGDPGINFMRQEWGKKSGVPIEVIEQAETHLFDKEIAALSSKDPSIDIMAANDLRNMLGAGIPDWVKLAHKHGFAGYDVPWGDTRGEVGIIFSPGATWLISFYIWQDTPWIDFGINQPLYHDVSNMLYNYFNADQPFWPLPEWAPTPETESTGDAGT